MKPRIFLFSDQEQSSVDLLTSLLALEGFPFNFADTKYFIHIGFNPPASTEVRAVLKDLPVGFYCSIGFKEASPGELWKFGDTCGMLYNTASVIPVYNAPILNFKISEESMASLKSLQSNYSAILSASQVPTILGTEVADEKLSNFDFSVRTTNVFLVENIVYLSDLLQFTEAALLRFPNFGRKSLNEVKEFLSERDLTLNQSNVVFSKSVVERKQPRDVVSDCAEHDVKEEIDELKDERTIDIIRARVGFGKRKTLQDLGLEYGITRERIRQIEAKGITKILKKPNNLFSMWNELILEKVQASIYPLEVDKFAFFEPAFEAIEVRAGWLLRFLIGLNKRDIENYSNGLSIVEFQGKQLLSEFPQDEFDEFQKVIVELFSNTIRKPLSDLKAECFKYSTPQKDKYFNY